jgi:hypothetical protein
LCVWLGTVRREPAFEVAVGVTGSGGGSQTGSDGSCHRCRGVCAGLVVRVPVGMAVMGTELQWW